MLEVIQGSPSIDSFTVNSHDELRSYFQHGEIYTLQINIVAFYKTHFQRIRFLTGNNYRLILRYF